MKKSILAVAFFLFFGLVFQASSQGFLKKSLTILNKDNGGGGDKDSKEFSAEEVAKKPDEPEPPSRETPVASLTPKTFEARCGLKVTVPGGWNVHQDEPNMLYLECQAVRSVVVTAQVNDYGKDFPVAASLKAYRESAKKDLAEKKIAFKEELRLGKAEGVLQIEVDPGNPKSHRRIIFQGYKGTSGVHIVASSLSENFDEYKETLEKTIRSIQL